MSNKPRFGWDIRTSPGTDGKGYQEGYARAFELWCDYQDSLPDINTNKINKTQCGTLLLAQLSSRAIDRTSGLSKDDVKSDGGADMLVAAIYKNNLLSTRMGALANMSELHNMRRKSNEHYRKFEARLSAQASKIASHDNKISVHPSILTMMLLNQAGIDDWQHVSILSFGGATESSGPEATTDDMIKPLPSGAVSGVIRQLNLRSNANRLDNQTLSAAKRGFGNGLGQGCGGHRGGRESRGGRERSQRMSKDDIKTAKMASEGALCGRKSH